MKNKILTWLALSVIFCLSSFETKAQSVYIQDIIEYIDKNGQEFDALIGVRGIRYTESLNLPKVTVLEGDYIVMKATSCTYVESVEGGHLYKLHLEIAPAMDFGERLRSHIEFTFDLEYDRWCSVDFWTVQPGLSIGEITPSEQDIAYRQSPQILTYSSDDRPSIQSVQWQQKDVYTSDWINISGANSYTYSPRPLSQTTEFRVVARSKGADIEHTEPAIVRVNPQLVGGTVSGDQTIFPDGIPLPFTNSTAAFGGSSDITYQWQAKTEQGNWTDVPNAKGLSYDPPALTTTTKFRRKAVSGEEAAYSNVVTVSVREPIAEYLSFRPIAGVVSEEDRDMRTAGLKTYEKIGILGADTDVGKFIERAFYYDYRGRIIQIVETNHLGGLSYYSTEYDFVGNILKSHELHTSDMQSASPANTADRSGSPSETHGVHLRPPGAVIDRKNNPRRQRAGNCILCIRPVGRTPQQEDGSRSARRDLRIQFARMAHEPYRQRRSRHTVRNEVALLRTAIRRYDADLYRQYLRMGVAARHRCRNKRIRFCL